jgi:hypothetical protein
MLGERYDPMHLCALGPTLGMAMAPMLTLLPGLLAEDALFQTGKADVAQRFPRTRRTGRPSPPVAGLLRLLSVTQL